MAHGSCLAAGPRARDYVGNCSVRLPRGEQIARQRGGTVLGGDSGGRVDRERRAPRHFTRRRRDWESTLTNTQRIRVLALSPIPEEGAGCRFRVAQYIPYLREAGFDVTISSFYTPEFFRLVYRHGHHTRKALSFARFSLRRVGELLTLGRYDLVFLYREAIPLGPPVIESLIARRGIPIVYDFDDAIFLRNVSEANKAFAFLKDPGRVARILDAVPT